MLPLFKTAGEYDSTAHTRHRGRGRRLTFQSLEPRLALAVTLLHETFNDDPVDSQPASADFVANGNGPEGFIQIGGTGGVYGTPFAPGTDNRSLIIDNPGQAQPIISWTNVFSDDPADFKTGTVSFDLFLPEPAADDFWTYIDFRLGYGGPDRNAPTTVGDTTVWNSFRVSSIAPDVVVDNGNQFRSSPVTSLTELHVVYEIDGPSRTYRLSINGSPIDFGTGNANRPWIAGAPGINTLAFAGAFPSSSSVLAIDNLLIEQGRSDSLEFWSPPEDEPTSHLEWHQHRGNKRLTGEALVDEDIVSGADILWSTSIASRESWIGVAPGGDSANVALPDSNIIMSESERISWNIGGPYFDLGGVGNLIAQSTHSLRRVGDFIPGNGVLELLEGEVFNTTFGQGVIRLFVYDHGNWVQQWQSPMIPAMFGTANLIAGDFDNDGQQEVALTPWDDLYLLDMVTGQVEDTVRFKPSANESGRPYGWLGALDMNHDGRHEFVEMGDFQDFISVLGWNNSGDLVKLWEHVFEPRLAGKQTTHRPMAFPVRDVTGDGHPEIATTIFNESGDQRWHVRIFDALTGTPTYDLVDHAIDGSRDVNGDGDFELFVRQTDGPLLPPASVTKILDWNGAGFDTLWSQVDAGFVSQDISDFPLAINSATATGKLDLLTGPLSSDGPDVFFTRQVIDAATNESRIDIWELDGTGTATHIGSANGINLDVLAVRETSGAETSVLLSTEVVGDTQLAGDYNLDGLVGAVDYSIWRDTKGQSVIPGTGADGDGNGIVDDSDYSVWKSNYGSSGGNVLRLTGFDGSARFSQLGAPTRSSAVVGRLAGPSDQPTVIVQGGSESILAIQPQSDGQVTTKWVRAGLGGFTGATQFHGQHENSGAWLGDVNGNGLLETIYATQGESGQARLVATAPDGSEVWHADFDVPGGRRVFNEPGLVLWRTGYFTSANYEDVLVQIMRGIGGTGEFHLLDGQTGQTLWTRDTGNTPGTFSTQRGAGEAHLAVYDWDNDGLDEAVNFNPDMFYVVDGSGANLVDRAVLGGGVFPGGSPLYGQPIVADFLNNGSDSILFAGSYSQLGLTDKNGNSIWHTPFVFDDTPGFIQGVGDVDGDGDLDLLSPGHPIAPATHTVSRFHAYDAATGALLWEVPLPGRPFAPVGGAYSDSPTLSVSADIDNDGRAESLFAIGSTLYAVGADPGGASGSIEWTFKPDNGLLGAPIIADGNGDGRAEIIVVSTSGNIYGIGNVQEIMGVSAATTVLENSPAPARERFLRDRVLSLFASTDDVIDIAESEEVTFGSVDVSAQRPVVDPLLVVTVAISNAADDHDETSVTPRAHMDDDFGDIWASHEDWLRELQL